MISASSSYGRLMLPASLLLAAALGFVGLNGCFLPSNAGCSNPLSSGACCPAGTTPSADNSTCSDDVSAPDLEGGLPSSFWSGKSH